MSSTLRNTLSMFGIFTLCALCFAIGRWGGCPRISTEIRVDTIRVEVPKLIEVEKVQTEYIPIIGETLVDTIYIKDTIRIPFTIERRTYGDERYRAIVSGAVVGDIYPSLDEIEIYARNETRIIEHKAPMFRPYLRGSIGRNIMGIGGGVSIKDRVDVDVQYMRLGNDNMVVFGANYRFNIKSK